jgi:hypothetical protein
MTSSVPSALPLTGAQTGVWFDEQLSSSRLGYNMADYLDISGPLDERLLGMALELVLDEAECTRARFSEADGLPVQRIEPLGELPLRVVDFSGRSDPVGEALRLMDEDLHRPFELVGGLLLRMVLVRVSADRSLLYMAMHHLLSDGYSRLALYRRFSEVYGALAEGCAPPGEGVLPPLGDLLAEEASYLGSNALERDRRFWESHLAGGAQPVSLAAGDPVQGLSRSASPPATRCRVPRSCAAASSSTPRSPSRCARRRRPPRSPGRPSPSRPPPPTSARRPAPRTSCSPCR